MATGRLPDPNTAPLTAKGDLYTYSTVPARLAVGSNGDTLVADSSQTAGLRYNPQNALANPVINGGMDIWQRGTSISVSASAGYTYTADRWSLTTGANQACTISRQTTSDTTNLPNIQYSLRFQRNSGQTGTSGLYLFQSFESVNTTPFAGRTVTLSFYAKAGANYSSTSSLLTVAVNAGTGTDQQFFVMTGATTLGQTNVTLTTTWQRFVTTFTIGSTITQIAPYFLFTPVGTAGANDWFEVTGVQIDLGTYTASTAPAFRRSGGTLAGELSLAQRYYYRIVADSIGKRAGSGFNQSTTVGNHIIPFPTTMRVVPTAVETTGTAADYTNASAAGNITCTSVPAFGVADEEQAVVQANVASGLTAGDGCMLRFATANAYLGFTAEL